MKIKNILIVTLFAIAFTACGGSDTIEGFAGNTYEKINIDVTCTTPNKPNLYIELKSNDQIVKDSTDVNVTIIQDSNALKKICINKGVAHISRENI